MGDPTGTPVLRFHGGGMARLIGIGQEAAGRLGVRLVCVERPGFGLSDFQPNRTIRDWPRDVAELADQLGMERFAVRGVSAGCPYALACGHALVDRLTVVGVVAGVLPPEFYELDEMAELVRRDLGTAHRRAEEYVAEMAGDIAGSVAAMANRSGPDGDVYGRPEVQAQFRANRREAFRRGIPGAVHDILLLNQPWGFSLERVATPVRWWHGELDPVTSPALRPHEAAFIRLGTRDRRTQEPAGVDLSARRPRGGT